jgi:hypothetical protein
MGQLQRPLQLREPILQKPILSTNLPELSLHPLQLPTNPPALPLHLPTPLRPQSLPPLKSVDQLSQRLVHPLFAAFFSRPGLDYL